MGLIEATRDALKDIPISEVLRERVSLALDRLAESEAKIESLQSENGGVKAQLERERTDHEQTKKELQRLQELMHEEIRFVHAVEFRKGTRTGGVWMPFCPKCHLPINLPGDADVPYCTNRGGCGWTGIMSPAAILSEAKRVLG